MSGNEHDLKFLADCKPLNARRTACAIVGRHIRKTPRKRSLGDLLGQIEGSYPGTASGFERVCRFAQRLEAKLRKEALTTVTIDAKVLAIYRNVRIEQREGLDGLANEIIEARAKKGPIYLIQALMSKGKTKQVLRPIAWAEVLNKDHKLVVTNRQALVADLCQVCGLTNYQEADAEDLEATRELGICVNSLVNPKFERFIDQADGLLIDEISQVFHDIWNGCDLYMIHDAATGKPN